MRTADAQTDLSRRWAYKPLWFCHEAGVEEGFSRQLVVLTKQSMLKHLHSLEANATCGIADADYTE